MYKTKHAENVRGARTKIQELNYVFFGTPNWSPERKLTSKQGNCQRIN